MPQVMRWPQHRTEEVPQEVEKFLDYYFSLPSYTARGQGDLALSIFWPEIKETDLELFRIGYQVLDSMAIEKEKSRGQARIKDPFEGIE